MNINNSIFQKIYFFDREIFIKRDDLIDKDFSGNKARKLWYYLKNDFKDIKKIISYGSAQSNAMYSLSVLALKKGWSFEYVSTISSFLKQNPSGNYKFALANGMKFYENNNRENFAKSLIDEHSLFIKEGGANKNAQWGIQKLATEIELWAGERKFDIFLPSGTGTTALYLSKYSKFDIYTTPCVGDSEYLKKQFLELENENLPIILKTYKKYHFGKLYKELFLMNKELKEQTRIEFDLLYDPVGWICIKENLQSFKNPILYIHQGGIQGNSSMFERYAYKFPLLTL